MDSPGAFDESFDAVVEAPLRHQQEDAEALRVGIEQGQLVLYYQPKVDSFSGQLRAVEALVRWSHPTRGLVPPLEFIPLAEGSGLIEPLGAWVFAEACRQQAAWAHEIGPSAPPMVCVNVSGSQLRRSFPDLIRGIVADTGVLAEGVCLEITETAAMDDLDAAVEIVGDLKRLGLVVAIDDFGTGHSSLSQLKRFPFDEVKIDKSFVDAIGNDPDDTAIVAAIIAMAHALGLLVIAEGVETTDQLRILRNLGCEMVQGYLFSRPVLPDALAALGPVLQPTTIADSRGPTISAGAILIVDDTADVRRLAKLSLATSGFEVLEATSGEEALETARRLRPSGIVLDVSMPGMDGFEVCRTLRSDPLTSEAAILMLTSRADADDKIEAFSAGADDYMLKPFAPRDLVSRIRQAMDRRKAC